MNYKDVLLRAFNDELAKIAVAAPAGLRHSIPGVGQNIDAGLLKRFLKLNPQGPGVARKVEGALNPAPAKKPNLLRRLIGTGGTGRGRW